MGYKINTGVFQSGSLGTITTNVESVLALWTPLTPPADNSQIIFWWYLTLTVGTGGTSVQMRVRRGTTTAGLSLSAAGAVGVTAGAIVNLSGMAIDANSPQAAGQYALTVQVNAATANSTITDGVLFALCP